MKNILCLAAHPDDVELMAGGSIIRWIEMGCSVYVLDFTDGTWNNQNNIRMRTATEAIKEEIEVANFLGYKVENLGYQALGLYYNDDLVVETLRRIDQYEIDTLVAPWEEDCHYDHYVVSKVAKHCSKKIPRILYGQINYYTNRFFNPNFFIDISDYYLKKLDAIRLYESVRNRFESDWFEYLDATSKYYGKIVGCARAEGFIVNKFRF